MTPATAVAPVAVDAQLQTQQAIEVRIAPTRANVGHVRRITGGCLGVWNVGDPVVENALLAVSELVANSVEHGRGTVVLRVQCSGGELPIDIAGEDSAPTELRTGDDDDESGRGLLLCSLLARNWGVSEDGKTTWPPLVPQLALALFPRACPNCPTRSRR